MELRETTEQRKLRAELRQYFSTLLPADERRRVGEEGVGGDRFREVTKRMGQDGWLGIGWPTEYGGQGRSLEDQMVFFDEVNRAGLPFPFVTVNTVGPALMQHGTKEQKDKYLTGMLAGDIIFAIGYSEPEAGTDLAALKTRAVRGENGEWAINGNKVFTSGGNTSDYVWLAARTDADAPKHKGITIFITSCEDPGYTHSPIVTVGGLATTATYYNNVSATDADIVGELNSGWKLITGQLNHERVGLAATGGRATALWENTVKHARKEGLVDEPWVRMDLARAYARLQAMRLMNWKMTVAVHKNDLSGADAGATKVYGTETHLEVYRALQSVLAASGKIRPESDGAALDGQIEQIMRNGIVQTFGGGVNEVLRDMTATMGLGLPRGKR